MSGVVLTWEGSLDSLPSSMAVLANFPQFIVYRIGPSAVPGKETKIPCDPKTGLNCNAHDVSIHVDFGTAAAAAAAFGNGYGVGFVLTVNDPFWCLDIDNAWDGSRWSPLAGGLCAAFNGAAIEVSQSGRGLHIFGIGEVPPHTCKNVKNGLELYTEGRFIALTGKGAEGNILTDCSIALAALVSNYFSPPMTSAIGDVGWTDEPVPEWNGPQDDEDLLRRALASGDRSAAKAFGSEGDGTASFRDLWERNVDALAAKYPSQSGGEYDRSSADFALALHLAFWTGKNPERIRNLMYRSALVRDKWELRGDYYLPRTILRACGISDKVATGSSARLPEGVMLSDFQAYMPAHSYIFAPTGEEWPAASVDARIPMKNPKASRWLDQNRPVEQKTWAPGQSKIMSNKLLTDGGLIARTGCNTFNLYRPPAKCEGDPDLVGPWLGHVQFVYPDEWEHIVCWLAHRVQRPDEKINHALVLGGSQGVGKDTILEPVKAAVGPWNFSEVGPAHLLGRFNGFVKSVILRVSEARDLGETDRFKFYEHMKTYTAAPPDVLRVDEKNKGEYAVMNVCGVIITTNHKLDGIYLPADDRRHFVAWSNREYEDFSQGYWKEIYGFYESGGVGHVVAYLSQFDLIDFDAKAPPPKTSTFREIVAANHAPEDVDLSGALDSLGWPDALTLADVKGTCMGEPLGIFLSDRRNSRRIPHRMDQVGYASVHNPATKAGRWRIAGKDVTIYARKELVFRDRISAAEKLAMSERTA